MMASNRPPTHEPVRTVLFLCTGNYYRSRFAEHYFNHLADARQLPWRAISRGLATERNVTLPGTISRHTVAMLTAMGIPLPGSHRAGQQCTVADLQAADVVIALKEAEHRPLLAERYAGWEAKVRYWHVHDLDAAAAEVALAEIRELVDETVNEIGRGKD